MRGASACGSVREGSSELGDIQAERWSKAKARAGGWRRVWTQRCPPGGLTFAAIYDTWASVGGWGVSAGPRGLGSAFRCVLGGSRGSFWSSRGAFWRAPELLREGFSRRRKAVGDWRQCQLDFDGVVNRLPLTFASTLLRLQRHPDPICTQPQLRSRSLFWGRRTWPQAS